jgi:hypothetical protein
MKFFGRFEWLFIAAFATGACSSTTPSGESNNAGGASCGSICTHVESICGASAPACSSACAGWTSAEQDCVAGASTCMAAEACGSASASDAGPGQDSAPSAEDAATPSGSCSNGVSPGESICDPNSPQGNTLKVCSTNTSGGVSGKTLACGGATPRCSAEVVGGKAYAACCPDDGSGVDDPHKAGCKQ